MRIIQILESFAYGDAIGNHTFALFNELNNRGIENYIYANIIDPRLKQYAESYSSYKEKKDDIILYHLSTGSNLNRKVVDHNCKIIINYHNITPPVFFEKYNKTIAQVCQNGYDDVKYMSDKVDMVIADSKYNGEELKKIGYKCPIVDIPIVINFDQYNQKNNENYIEKNNVENETTKIIFVGRIAPNKKHEDIIADFYYYHKFYNNKSKLYLVGNYNGNELYYFSLLKYVKKLGLERNVVFTGHISFSEMIDFYKTGDLFLCESQHEGFCVPLVEAMFFSVPIIAYNSSAIGETVKNAGILIDKKDPCYVASLINQISMDGDTKKIMMENQKLRLKDFEHTKVIEQYMYALGIKEQR